MPEESQISLFSALVMNQSNVVIQELEWRYISRKSLEENMDEGGICNHYLYGTPKNLVGEPYDG